MASWKAACDRGRRLRHSLAGKPPRPPPCRPEMSRFWLTWRHLRMMARASGGIMFTTLEQWSPQLLSLVRIAFGITFVEHGTQKLFSFPVEPVSGLGPGMLLFVGFLETVCGSLVAVGL